MSFAVNKWMIALMLLTRSAGELDGESRQSRWVFGGGVQCCCCCGVSRLGCISRCMASIFIARLQNLWTAYTWPSHHIATVLDLDVNVTYKIPFWFCNWLRIILLLLLLQVRGESMSSMSLLFLSIISICLFVHLFLVSDLGEINPIWHPLDHRVSQYWRGRY